MSIGVKLQEFNRFGNHVHQLIQTDVGLIAIDATGRTWRGTWTRKDDLDPILEWNIVQQNFYANGEKLKWER